MTYVFIFSFLMALASYSSHIFVNKIKKHKDWVVSLAAGFFVSYLFLQLFPEIYSAGEDYKNIIFVAVLVGFSLFHVAEKLMYKYLKHDIIEGLEILHLAIFFVYHTAIGFLLVIFFRASFASGLFFFFSISILLLTSSAVFEVLHERKKTGRTIERLVMAAGFIAGSFIESIFSISLATALLLLGFVAGVLIYVVGREVLPREKKGNPFLFVLGVVLYAVILIYLNIFRII